MKEKTLVHAFIDNMQNKPQEPFLIYKKDREWCEVAWSEVGEMVKYMTLGLMIFGIKKGDRIAPISNTIPEMAYCCLAVAACGAIFSAIYHTNSPKECAHVINDSGARIAFAEDLAQLEKLKTAWPDCPSLERIIVFKMDGNDMDPRISTLEELIEMGKDVSMRDGDRLYNERMGSINAEDVISIIYTSGTTGAPKGVMFTHQGIIKALTEMTKHFPVAKNEKGIGYLPMAHAIELMDGHWRHVLFGFPHVYAESLQLLFDNVRETKPTFFFTTPRFYEKHYQRFTAAIDASSFWKRKLIRWCLDIGSKYQDITKDNTIRIFAPMLSIMHSIAHRIYFRKIKASVSERIRWSSSGAAPIRPEILLFFRSCGMPIYEGFGLTESQGLISLNRPGAWKIGTIGKPMNGLEVAFAEDGELLVKGWARCAGYWNNPRATEELFRDGWLHTGDLAHLDEDGFMQINGRKKEIIITSTGKNITPLIIQNLLKNISYISEALIFGEGKTYLTALVTLDEEKVGQWAKERNVPFKDFASLTKHPAVIGLIDKEITTKNQELARIEQIKKFTILEDQFRQDRDELTPTMKVKRRVVEKIYQGQIAAMYER
jgi:long-chain acyl-CoA synthetase